MVKPDVRVCKADGCDLEAAPRRQLCIACWLAKQPPIVRVEHAQARLATVAPQHRLARVPEKQWPEGYRWCGGCQSFVRLQDCSGSRCKACQSHATHLTRIKAGFGIDGETYQWILDQQLGRCAICRDLPKTTRFAIDHAHSHCKDGCRLCIRGLICAKCNHEILGGAHDSLQILRNAVAYMERPPMSGEWRPPQSELDAWEAAHPGEPPAPF